ncbi:hypothetical protein MML48_9g00018879 [Holotrichia oblita]|uniref:Uncharacterized protein n=1 Tax=Holotrichia oblita TaxID=644536 RepID=A0ACB9SJR0_HOLOL|nr:hypothetical protein MML48_9g00018879 [Holotrichia oblita]
MSVSKQNRRQTLPFAYQINRFISKYPDLKYNGSGIYCLMCRRRLVGWNAINCRQHVLSARHKQSRKMHMPYWTFVYDFIFMLSVCDIPQNMLDNSHFRAFWQKYVPNWALPTRKQVCTEFPHVKEVVENQIRCELRDKKLWVTVEIVDVKKDKVGNVLVRILEENYSSKPFLIASQRLKQLDADTIHYVVIGALMKFSVHPKNVLMFVTDESEHMLAAGAKLKSTCPNLLHIICILHVLHHITESIRTSYPDIDKLIISMKRIFVKSAKLTQQFQKICPKIPEPPQPLLASWEAWLKAAFYYNGYFDVVKAAMIQFTPKQSRYIKGCQQLFKDPRVEADLKMIHENYGFLVDAIEILQEASLSLTESMDMAENVYSTLSHLENVPGMVAAEKFSDILWGNPDYEKLRAINECLKEDRLNSDLQRYYSHANITCMDVERSLASYNAIFTSTKTCLSESAAEGVLMMQLYAKHNKRAFTWKK